MIIVAPARVANTGTSCKGIFHQIQNWLFILSFGGLVYIRNIGRVMLVMVDLHGGGVNMGLQGLKGVRKIRQRVRVGISRIHGSSCSGNNSGTKPLEEGTTATSLCV